MESKKKNNKNLLNVEKPKASGVGALLREERRNRSLELSQVAQKTKLRIHFLEAIEKEAWDELPAPVFVIGFIRAYARAMGLDERHAVELYKGARPFEPEVPKPLQAPEKTGRGRIILLILLLGVIGGVALYLWQQGKFGTEVPERAAENGSAETETVTPSAVPSVRESIEPPLERAEEPGPADVVEPEVGAPSETGPPETMEGAPAVGETLSSGETAATAAGEPGDKPLVLEAEVVKRTWVEISIDGKEPKSLFFQPGSHPRWEAGEEIDILIGNAGGMVLFFNEKKLKQLGKDGQVVRLKLPADIEEEDRGDH